MVRLSAAVLLVLGAGLAGLANFVQGQTITEYPIPTPGSGPYAIVSGPDGALWFTEAEGNKIGRITTAGIVTNEYPIPFPDSAPLDIVTVPGTGLAFTAYYAGGVGLISTEGSITGTFLPTPGSAPWGLTVGLDGAVWVAESGSNKIARITAAGTINEFPIPTPDSHPNGMVTGPDSAIWFVEALGNKIGRLSQGGAITEFPIPTADSQPSFITVGPDGALWFTENKAAKIGRITTSGVVTEFPIPTPNANPYGITAGPDGALWFTVLAAGGDRIGRITTGGVFTNEVLLPSAGGGPPFGITTGPDGALWFIEHGSGKIGRLLPGTACTPDPTTLCLNNGRFKVQAQYTTASGSVGTIHPDSPLSSGAGQAVGLTGDTGYFWFFSSNNVEMIIKVVDGRAVNGAFWVFAAGLTNVNVVITVTDTQTQAVKTYTNPQGTAFLPIQDTSAFSAISLPENACAPFADTAAGAANISAGLSRLLGSLTPKTSASGLLPASTVAACNADDITLCLNGGRFQVRAAWTTPDGVNGSGHAVALTGDTGYFWFFSSNNVEMIVKVVDGNALNNHFWVFAGGLINVRVDVTVVDTQTGSARTYTNPQGTAFQPVQDTSAFLGP